MGFNIKFILERRPALAVELIKLYDEARQLHSDDSVAAAEDYLSAGEEWSRFVQTAF